MGGGNMARKEGGIENLLQELAGGLREVLDSQKSQSDRLSKLEERIGHIEEAASSSASIAAKRAKTYDYRVLQNQRTYTLHDTQGKSAEMVSVRRCVALTGMPKLRTRYHTGSGSREAAYAYRLIREGDKGEPPWVDLEYTIDKGAGADFSAYLNLPEPVLSGEVFEVRHQLKLENAFTTRNEWVTLVVEYPTDFFRLEVVLPPGRKLAGARREESEGASNSFNKRRVFPRTDPDTGRIILEWEEPRPVTGRAYTLFWDW